MPKPTFFNLPEEKKERLKKAVYDEYINKPYDKVTTRTLTQKAGIPMGSLYQYFENKDEMYIHYFLELEYKSKQIFLDEINWISDKNDVKQFLDDLLSVKVNNLSPYEEKFYMSINGVPESVLKKISFDYYDKLSVSYKKYFEKLMQIYSMENDIKLNKYFDFFLYIYITNSFNLNMYCQKNNIVDESKILELGNVLYRDIFLKSLE